METNINNLRENILSLIDNMVRSKMAPLPCRNLMEYAKCHKPEDILEASNLGIDTDEARKSRAITEGISAAALVLNNNQIKHLLEENKLYSGMLVAAAHECNQLQAERKLLKSEARVSMMEEVGNS
jgi:hypothetical protein